MDYDIINKIQTYIRENGINQIEMSKRLDCSESLLSMVLRGKSVVSKNMKRNLNELMSKSCNLNVPREIHPLDLHDNKAALVLIFDIIKKWDNDDLLNLVSHVISKNEEIIRR